MVALLIDPPIITVVGASKIPDDHPIVMATAVVARVVTIPAVMVLAAVVTMIHVGIVSTIVPVVVAMILHLNVVIIG